MKEFAFGFRPVLESTTKECRSGIVENTVPLPPEMVYSVVVNKETKWILPPALKKLTEPDFLISIARLTIPWQTNRESSKRILVPTSWGRAIPFLYGRIPYAESLVGHFVFGKGALISGKFYRAGEQDISAINNAPDPIGFFGDSDAKKEVYFSNALLSEGARSSLSLGYIVLRAHLLHQFILDTWQKANPTLGDILIRNLERVLSNDDEPALLLRVGATTERISGFPNLGTAEIIAAKRRAAIAEGARVLREEFFLYPRLFREKYLHDLSDEQVDLALKTIAQRQKLKASQAGILKQLVVEIAAREISTLTKFILEHPEINCSHQDDKDRDYAFLRYDYEEWSPHPLGANGDITRFVIEDTRKEIARTAFHYLLQLEETGFTSPSLIKDHAKGAVSIRSLIYQKVAATL